MTWKSHIAIATSVALPFNPNMIIVSSVGSIAPDLIEYILKFFGIHIPHRGQTHYLIIPLAIIFISAFIDFHNIIFWFGIGYLTHWLADSLTISGVPISPFDNHRIKFLNGIIRTGEPLEYIISFGLLFATIAITNPMQSYINKNEYKFNPYFIHYQDLYNKNIIDEKTYRDNKFKIF